MVRFFAAVVVIGGALCLGGLISSRHIPQNAVIAQGPVPQAYQGNTAAAQNAVAHPVAVNQPAPPSDAADPFSGENPVAFEEKVAVPKNRFDRGRLGEEFDGEQIQSSSPKIGETGPALPSITSEALDPNFTTEVAQVGPVPKVRTSPGHFEDDELSVGQLVIDDKAANPLEALPALPGLEVPPNTPRTEVFPGADLETSPATAIHPRNPRSLDTTGAPPEANHAAVQKATSYLDAPSYTASKSRVTIIRTPDHQIRIIAEDRSKAKSATTIPPDAILITAEEFSLTPSAEPAGAIQLQCAGHVEILGPLFNARCAKLAIKNSDFVLEGTAVQPAEIRKLSKIAQGTDKPTADGSEFHLSARQISFSLSLDAIKVSNSVSILPVAPSPEKKAEDAPDDDDPLGSPNDANAPPVPKAVEPLRGVS
jgi:hypothetical protein